MKEPGGGRCGVIAGDLLVALVTLVQLIFLTGFHRYIAWRTTQPDGSVVRLSLLTDGYSSWLPFPITASILVLVVTAVMLFYDRYWFRQAAWILFCVAGVAVVVSLASIFPFDFSVIPDPAVVAVLPTVVTVFLILMAVFYAANALVLFVKLRRHLAE